MIDHEAMKREAARFDERCMQEARELTIGELLDRRIEKAERLVGTLRDLKASLPGSYLNSGASRVSAIIEL